MSKIVAMTAKPLAGWRIHALSWADEPADLDELIRS